MIGGRLLSAYEHPLTILGQSGNNPLAYIKEHKEADDCVYVLFGGVWGCSIEMWFEGEAACSIKEYDLKVDDPTWYDSTFMLHDGFFYLVDEGDMNVEDIDNTYNWLKARRVKYHVIPN